MFEYGVFKGLKSLRTKMDYSVEESFSVSASGKPVDKVYAPYQNFTYKDGFNFGNFMNSNWKNKDDEGAKTIKIGSWTLYNCAIAQVVLEVKLVVKVTGEIKVVVTMSGSQGVEYRNGNLRAIKEKSTDVDVQIKGKIELTVGPGISLRILNKWEIVEFAIRVGLGAEISAVVHLVDTEGHLYDEYSGDDLTVHGMENNQDYVMYCSSDFAREIAQAYEKLDEYPCRGQLSGRVHRAGTAL